MLPVIFALAWPTMLEELMQTLVQYIDTAMVGALGTEATAAVGATSTVGWMVGSSISALGVGFLAYIAKACGAGRKQEAHQASAQAAMVACIVGALFTALTLSLSPMVPVWMQVDPAIRELTHRYFFILYVPMLFRTASILFGTMLRAAGDTKTPMRVGVLMNLINIVLNFLLIYPSREISLFSHRVSVYGAGMGVEGAAIASAISYTVGGVLITAVLWRHPMVSPKGCSLRPDGRVLRPCLKVALPNMLQRFGTSLGYVVFASMINALGQTATAAHTIANTVESAFYIPGFGMQTAAATLSGNALGAGDNDRMKRLARTILPLEVGLMTVSGALLFAFARPLMAMFSSDERVIALGSTVLRMVAVSEPFYGVPIVIEGMMQAAGVTPEQLEREKVVPVPDAQPLDWEYYCYVREHRPDSWTAPTAVLIGERDELEPPAVTEAFCKAHGCGLEQVPGAGHWLHTPEELAVLRSWLEQNLSGCGKPENRI